MFSSAEMTPLQKSNAVNRPTSHRMFGDVGVPPGSHVFLGDH